MLCQHTFFNPSQSYPPLHSKSEQSSTSAPSCHKCFPHPMKHYETMVVDDVLIESVEQMQVMLMQKNHGEDRLSHKEGQGVARWSLAPVRNAEMPWQKRKFWREV